jgi:hypothetical protein
VDRQGRMRGYYSMGDADTLDRIEAAVKTLF